MTLDLGTLRGFLDMDDSPLDAALDKAGEKLKDWASENKGKLAAGAIAMGTVFATSLVANLNVDAARDKVAASLALTSDQSAKLGKVAGELYASNYGDSLEGVHEAVGLVIGSMKGMRDASAGVLQQTTRDALNFSKVFDVDVSQAVVSAQTLITNGLAKDSSEAFDLLVAGAQTAGPAMVEPVLDAVNEYSKHFAMLGISGEQAMDIISSAASGGEIAIDKAADAIKEFGIRATDITDTGAQQALTNLGLSGKDMADQLLAGGESAKQATATIANALLAVEDPAQQSADVLALFGTQSEDIGKQNMPAFLRALEEGTGNMAGFEGSAKDLDKQINDNTIATLQSWGRELKGVFYGLTNDLVPAVDKATGFIDKHKTETLIVASALGIFIGLVTTYKIATLAATAATEAWTVITKSASVAHAAYNAVMGIGRTTAATWIGVKAIETGEWIAGTAATAAATVATVAQTAATWALNAAVAVLTSPITLVVLAIGALIAIIVLAIKYHEEIGHAVAIAWNAVKDAIGAAVSWAGDRIGDLVGWVTGMPDRIRSAATGMFDGIKDAFRAAINWIIGKWNDLHLTLGGQHVSLPFGQGFDIPSVTLNTPDLPTLAVGAVVRASPGGTALVAGEGGRDEIVTDKRQMAAFISDAMRDAGGSSTGLDPEVVELLRRIDARLAALPDAMYEPVAAGARDGSTAGIAASDRKQLQTARQQPGTAPF